MKTEKLIVGLVALTLAMQGVLLYRQGKTSAGKPTAASQRAAVVDATPNTKIDINNMTVRGKDGARLVLVEFSDYECPFCQRHATSVGKQLNEKFVMTGLVKQAFANNPLQMHGNAKQLAAAALCAGQQGHYWEMHDNLFDRKPKQKADIVADARKLGLNSEVLERCLDAVPAELAKRIEQDQKVAQELKLTGTPAFALGTDDGKGNIAIRKLIFGAQPLDVFEKAIAEISKKAATLKLPAAGD